MKERGDEVERLMSLSGTPLLVDTDGGGDIGHNIIDIGRNVTGGDGRNDRNSRDHYHADGDYRGGKNDGRYAGGQLSRDHGGASSMDRKKTLAVPETDNPGVEKGQVSGTAAPGNSSRRGSGGERRAKVQSKRDSGSGRQNSVESPGVTIPKENEKDKRNSGACRSDPDNGSGQSQEALNVERIAATASIPLLPCFSSVGARNVLGVGRHSALAHCNMTRSSANIVSSTRKGEGRAEGWRGAEYQNLGLKTSASAGDIGVLSMLNRHDPAENSRNTASAIDRAALLGTSGGLEGARAWASSRNAGRGGVYGEVGGSIATTAHIATADPGNSRAAAASAREYADILLASHLTPFPTITKNRSLHAVSQPIVRHSAGFSDACRGENSRLGTTAWRVARNARHEGLVAPAERLSIARQIEAGFDALQERTRASPIA